MRILGIILFEFLLGYILQAFSIVLGLYALNKQKIDVKKYIITSSVMSVVIFVTRLLPIAFGVHTLLNFVVMFLFGALYLKLPPNRTVKANLVVHALILGLEAIDAIVFTLLLGEKTFLADMNTEPFRSEIGFVSEIVFSSIVFVIYNTSCSKLHMKGRRKAKGYLYEGS